MTRDENFSPILELANSLTESPDHLTYTFKLRQGIRFHNGKAMTSADVVASFDRYARVGLHRSTLGSVDSWDAPDKDTFVIHMKKVQPTFLEDSSSFSSPIVIVPAEEKDDPPMQLKPIGTGPWQLVELVPGGHAKLKRYDGYRPNTNFEREDGLRRIQAGLLRHGDLPHRHRAAGAGDRSEERGTAGRRGRASQGAT